MCRSARAEHQMGDGMHQCCLTCDTIPYIVMLRRSIHAGQHLQNINWVMAFIITAWFVITVIYIVVRATKSLHLGKATAYGVWVLVMEVKCYPTQIIAEVIHQTVSQSLSQCSNVPVVRFCMLLAI